MSKIFGFFCNKSKKNKVLKIVLIGILIFALTLAGVLIGKSTSKKTDLLAISKSLNTYDISLTYEDNYKFKASQTLTLTNSSSSTWEYVKFNLYPTAFNDGAVNKPVSALNIDNAYPNGISYGKFEITSVLENKENSNWKTEGIDNNVLVVNLLNPLGAGEKTQISIDFNFTLPNINHRYGYGNNAINVANFYPILAVYESSGFVTDPYNYNGDPFYSEMSNYNVTLTVPSKFVVAHTGYEVKRSSDNNLTTYVLKALAVRDFAFVMSEKFSVLEASTSGVNIKYYYYSDADPQRSLQAGIDSVETFNQLFGKYPYSTYSIVQTNFLHGGMEYPNLVYISDEISKHSDYINVIIHETAHQWWYQLVGSNAYKHAWLDEGLTEFSTVMFYEKNPSYNVNVEELLANATNSYISFIELCESVLGSVNTSMNRALNEYDTEPEYVYMTYVKGMLLFENLRSLIGNSNFERALKTYFTENQFKIATPETLIKVFEKVSLRKLDSFFASWLEGKVVLMPIKNKN